MIAESDLIDVINEIHQYSVLLIETQDKSLFGVYRDASNKAAYLSASSDVLTKVSRSKLGALIAGNATPQGVSKIALDEFLRGLSGKKARHIWLESVGRKKSEMGFMSVRELKAFLRR
jgi:hypothetical protein